MLQQGSTAIRDVSRLSYVCFFQECMTEYVRLCKLILRFFYDFLHFPHSYLSRFGKTSSTTRISL